MDAKIKPEFKEKEYLLRVSQKDKIYSEKELEWIHELKSKLTCECCMNPHDADFFR